MNEANQDLRSGQRIASAKSPACPWRPFPVEALPEPLRSFVVEESAAIGCDPSMVALPGLGGCAGAIGTTRMIYLKRGWTEPSVLWLNVVARSGSLKTPAHKHSLRPLHLAQAARFREHEQAMKRFEVEVQRYERDYAAWKRPGNDRGDPPEKPEPPVCVRYVVDQCTVEALAPILRQNPRGVVLVRDESSGWLRGMNEYKSGRGSDVANWLQLHDAGTIIVDRKTGQRTIHIPQAAVSVAGTIQPDTLRDVLTPEFFSCGLAARLLLAAPPDRKIQWSEREAPVAVIEQYANAIVQLLALDHSIGRDGQPEPVNLRLSRKAKAVFLKWHAECADRLAAAPDDRTAATLSKCKGAAARLALVCQLVADSAATAISVEAMRSGVTLARWFADEAERVYARLDESPKDRDRRELVELIQRKGGTITVRQLMRSSHRFQTAEAAEMALSRLALAGTGTWDPVEVDGKPGRPTRRFRLVEGADVDTNGEIPSEDEDLSTSTPSSDREVVEL